MKTLISINGLKERKNMGIIGLKTNKFVEGHELHIGDVVIVSSIHNLPKLAVIVESEYESFPSLYGWCGVELMNTTEYRVENFALSYKHLTPEILTSIKGTLSIEEFEVDDLTIKELRELGFEVTVSR